jgi:uncharacterized protein YbjT (DUF2867 family)
VRVLLLGAGGFIGRELLAALAARGHRVTAALRRRAAAPPLGAASVVTIDLNAATEPESWTDFLGDCDAVVNCAGVLQGAGSQSIEAIHAAAPIALFRACESSGVRRVVQVSAISAERAAGTAYALTKLAADDFLRATSLEWTVLRPSLVYARGAYGGTALLRALAALPFAIPVPGDGKQAFQPIHVDDLAQVVAQALETDTLVRATLDPVGPDVVTLRRILEDYRRWLGIAPAPVVTVPAALVRLATRFGDRFGGALNSTAAAQLAHGNTGDFAAFAKATGLAPRRWRDGLAGEPAHGQDRWHARLYFVRPLLRAAIAALWVGSALAGAFAIGEWAPRVAAALGLGVAVAGTLLAALCAADLAIGILVLRRWQPGRLAAIQVALVGAYTLAATALWPRMWADPLGVLVKNLPILGAILALGAIEEDR